MDAEELKPDPGGTLELTAALNPPVFRPLFLKPAAIPLTNASVVPSSESFFSVSLMSIDSSGYPSE